MAQSVSMERSRIIPAAARDIYPLIADFHRWTQWSPWEKLDADLERTYAGAESGVGARYGWAGKKAGSGTMEIVATDPDRRVDIALAFLKPFPAKNLTVFALEPVDGGTKVTWRMTGDQGLVTRVFFKLFNVEKGITRDFDEGLESLARAVVPDGA